MDPIPTLVKSFSLVVQHEREFIGISTNLSSQDSIALTASTKGTSTSNKNGSSGKPPSRNTKYCEN